jgi:hypothetical protein
MTDNILRFNSGDIPNTASGLAAAKEVADIYRREIPPEQFEGFEGRVDQISLAHLHGWAYNKSEVNIPVSVDILIDGKLYQRVECDRFRQDLKISRIGNAHHAFKVALPHHIFKLGGKNHTITVRYTNWHVELPGSPLVIRKPQ